MSRFHKQRSKTAMSSWRERILSQQASGQVVSEYCQKHGICPCSFYAWRKRLGMNGPAPEVILTAAPATVRKHPVPGFLRIMPDVIKAAERPVNVEPRGQHPVLWIETPGGYRVSVGGGADLAQVLEVLEQQAGLTR